SDAGHVWHGQAQTLTALYNAIRCRCTIDMLCLSLQGHHLMDNDQSHRDTRYHADLYVLHKLRLIQTNRFIIHGFPIVTVNPYATHLPNPLPDDLAVGK